MRGCCVVGFVVAVVAVCLGCSSEGSDTGTTSSGGSGGAAGSGATGGSAAFDYWFKSIVVDESNEVVEGFEICAHERDDIDCVTTDELGTATIKLPENTTVVVTYEKQGFLTKYRPIRTGETGNAGNPVWIVQSRQWYEDELAKAGGSDAVDLDNNGLIGLQTGPIAEIDFRVEPEPSDTPLYGPVRSCVIDSKLEFCAQFTDNDVGVVAFANVKPGSYQASVSKSGLSCTAHAFPCADEPEGCAELEVFAGVLTHVYFDCVEP